MRLAFSTLGLPGLPLAEVIRLATDHGWAGLELRCAPGEPVHPDMTAAARARARHALDRAGLIPLAVAGYVGVAAPGEDGPVVAELLDQLRLAADLRAAYVRVFPQGGEGWIDDADQRAARRLAEVADRAAELGVSILLETHDSHRGGRDVARVLELVAHPAIGALWDLLHTRLAGETPSATWGALRPHLGYVQVKDIVDRSDLTPVALGAGSLPVGECVRLLPPDCWVSWEYEAPWYPDAAPFGALLGPGAQYLAALRS
ncbi:sugar phosphate isomerase/epimerase [Kitasatospora sp. NBC_00240]|uniref:sugar phosphate isomerase/epimerase family protein n=1 Tax=Kitasatospora sp. NBC_00240 TaxID=2903567 RepID=UPI00224EE4E7|nr:sugar phosphate isomerase/epimerase [Kitasatospora sp. NBC_00240]MCX5208415.1 sugar phosphate isomerase/epimerase [Kitasatospora sp. NBC_00240]